MLFDTHTRTLIYSFDAHDTHSHPPKFFITFDAHNLSFSLNHIYPSVYAHTFHPSTQVLSFSLYFHLLFRSIFAARFVYFSGIRFTPIPIIKSRFDLIPYIHTQCLSKYVSLAAFSTLISNKKPPKNIIQWKWAMVLNFLHQSNAISYERTFDSMNFLCSLVSVAFDHYWTCSFFLGENVRFCLFWNVWEIHFWIIL